MLRHRFYFMQSSWWSNETVSSTKILLLKLSIFNISKIQWILWTAVNYNSFKAIEQKTYTLQCCTKHLMNKIKYSES